MIKDCSTCYFCDKCNQDTICEDYYSISQEVEDVEIERYIESQRAEFLVDWNRYIEYNTYDFND